MRDDKIRPAGSLTDPPGYASYFNRELPGDAGFLTSSIELLPHESDLIGLLELFGGHDMQALQPGALTACNK
jgi:hypothetical protein